MWRGEGEKFSGWIGGKIGMKLNYNNKIGEKKRTEIAVVIACVL